MGPQRVRGRRPSAPRAVLAAVAVLAGVVAAVGVALWVAPRWRGEIPLDPVALRVGSAQVHWYGLLIVLAFVPGWLVARPEMRRAGVSEDDVITLLLIGIPLGFIGARAGFVIQNLPYFSAHPADIFRTWLGGLSIHGVLAGAGLAIGLFSWRRHVSPLGLADMAAPSILLGQAIGRWGNFFNQELFGYPTRQPWGLYIAPPYRPPAYAGESFFHPVFFYESMLDLAGALVLLGWRRWARDRQAGELAALYLVVYSAARWAVEFFRIGEPLAAGMTLAQWVSLALAGAGAAWLAWRVRHRARVRRALPGARRRATGGSRP